MHSPKNPERWAEIGNKGNINTREENEHLFFSHQKTLQKPTSIQNTGVEGSWQVTSPFQRKAPWPRAQGNFPLSVGPYYLLWSNSLTCGGTCWDFSLQNTGLFPFLQPADDIRFGHWKPWWERKRIMTVCQRSRLVDSLQRISIVKCQEQSHETSYSECIWSGTFPRNKE